MHLDSVVGDVQVCQVLEKLQIFFSDIVDVHTGQFRPDGLVRKFDTAGVKQEEAIEDSSWQSTRIEPCLHLLTIDLSLLIWTVDQFVVVLHLGLFLTDLDHTIEVCNLHGEAWLLFLTIYEAFVVIFLPTSSTHINVTILTSIHLCAVDRLRYAHLFELVVWIHLIKGNFVVRPYTVRLDRWLILICAVLSSLIEGRCIIDWDTDIAHVLSLRYIVHLLAADDRILREVVFPFALFVWAWMVIVLRSSIGN